MKVLQIVPVSKSAITIQAQGIAKHNKDIEIKMITFHPKRPSSLEIINAKSLMDWADVVDCQYWKSSDKIKEILPIQWNKSKKILTHYNPYNLKEKDWKDYLKLIVVNSYQASILPNAKVIPLSIDLDFFKFSKNYTTEKTVNMSVSRIEGKKGVLEIAKACGDLGYKFVLVGRISDQEYMKRVKLAGGKSLVFKNDVSDIELRKCYYESAIHICNSVDDFESGTLPILESMACGVPVLTRNVGHVPDLYNGKNMSILKSNPEDIDNIKTSLKFLMDSRKTRAKIRAAAEETVKSRSHKIRAIEYRKVYEEALNGK